MNTATSIGKGQKMKDIPEEIRSSFTDYELNLIHGLLVDEEIRLKEKKKSKK